MGIPVHAITSADDLTCIASSNLDLMAAIPTLTSQVIEDGWDHIGMLNNDPLYLSNLIESMPFESIPVSDPLICPVVVIPESTCELHIFEREEEEEQQQRESRKRERSKKKKKRSGSSSSSRRRELSSSSSSSGSKKKRKKQAEKKQEPTGPELVFVGECTEDEMRDLMEEY